MNARTPVVWVDDPNVYPNRTPIMRKDVDPNALHGHKDVNLAWLKKHAAYVSYELRWWDGPSGHVGKWHVRSLEAPMKPAELRKLAAAIAATETVWEVSVTMLARTHGRHGWEYCQPVWSFGHAKRETTDAKRIRGEAP